MSEGFRFISTETKWQHTREDCLPEALVGAKIVVGGSRRGLGWGLLYTFQCGYTWKDTCDSTLAFFGKLRPPAVVERADPQHAVIATGYV